MSPKTMTRELLLLLAPYECVVTQILFYGNKIVSIHPLMVVCEPYKRNHNSFSVNDIPS